MEDGEAELAYLGSTDCNDGMCPGCHMLRQDPGKVHRAMRAYRLAVDAEAATRGLPYKPRARRASYTAEFKAAALAAIDAGETPTAVRRRLGMKSSAALHNWLQARRLKEGGGRAPGP